MTSLTKLIVVEVMATIIGTMAWEVYKKYCKFCWERFSK